MRRRWERLGLRARISLLFALGGLLLSAIITLATLGFARQNLLDDRDQQALSRFSINAQRVQNNLTAESDDAAIQAIVANLTAGSGAFPLLRVDGVWYRSALQDFDEDSVPDGLVQVVESEDRGAATIRTSLDGTPAIVSGILLPEERSRGAVYYEALLLGDVEDTLASLAVILFGAGAVTTVVAAALGSWAAGRTLSPVTEIRRAAESLAAGELDTRLEPPADADLASVAASFNGMARSLEDRIDRDTRFASEVSHELRSPLMTLKASLEVLENNRDALPERSQTALQLLSDDVARFSQLVEDLLEISRFDVGTASLELEPLLVVEFIRQAISHSSRPDAVVAATPDVEDLVIVADKRRLAQVVSNLIDNADKYGGDSAIEVQVSAADGTVFLAVEDQGQGVPVEERSVIFDRFSRGVAGGRRGDTSGSGLGLALVAEHVGLHGGTVWVEDRHDGAPGARFVVALPAGDVTEEELDA